MTEARQVAGELRPDVCYVTPTRRLAHHLRAQHDAACVAQGLRSWRTPQVRTWDALLRERFEADRSAGLITARWLDGAQAQLIWETIVRRDPALEQVLTPAGLGAAAARTWQLLHEYSIPLQALEHDGSPEVRAFARWSTEFTRRIRHGNWFDPASAAATVAPPPAGTRLALVGFDRLTPAQDACVRRFEAAGVIVDRIGAPAPGERDVAVVGCRDFAAELESAARWAAQRLQAQPDLRVAVIVPALRQHRDTVRQVFDRVFAPQALLSGGPAPESQGYELAAARPLADRPVIAAALAWLEALGAPTDFAACSTLLRGAFDGAAAAEAVARAELDAELRRYETGSCGLPRIARLAATRGCPATAELLERALRRSRNWQASRLPSAWATEFGAVLRDVGWPGATVDSTGHQAVQRWQQLLGEFGSADDVAGAWSAATALGQLRQLCVDSAFEAQEIAAPVLVIDPDTCAGMRFDAAWICGLDAARWPGPASPEPFLPREWQARQRIPWATAEACAASSRAVLERLVACADTVICSVPQFEDEAPLLPSALLDGLPRAALEELELWPGLAPAQVLHASRPVLEALVDGKLPPIAPHQIARGGARLIELQAACPFRAAVEFRLGGRQLDEPARGVAATERGSLAHAVLQSFWEDVRSQKALLEMPPAARASRVRGLVEAALGEQRAGADKVLLRLLELEQRWLEQRVLELLERDAERAPFEVHELEQPHNVEVGGVQVRVKLDRVDRLADGSLAIIDYKTGRNAQPSGWMRERPDQPQLPLYVRAFGADKVKALAFGVVRKGGTGYTGYVRDAGLFAPLTPFDASKKPFKEYGSWDELALAWQQRLDALGMEHAQGNAQLAPNPREACRYCHLPGLCRVDHAKLADADEVGGEGDA